MSGEADIDAASIAAFFDTYAAAWNAYDVEALLDCLAFPHLVATGTETHFFEDDDEALVNLEALIEKYRRHGVATMAHQIAGIEPLPDEAARVTLSWTLGDAAEVPLLGFPGIYTIASEADSWLIVAVDAWPEVEAWAAKGWA